MKNATMTSSARSRTLRALLVSATVVASLVLPARPSSALSPNENFIIVVYKDFLLRGPSADEMTWWTAYLGSGTRSAVVSNVLNSSEFKTMWVAGTQSYYLGYVDVEGASFASAVSALSSSGDFVETEVSTVAGADYYSIHGGTNTGYVEAVYQDVLLRAADPSGLSYWVGRLNAGTSTRAHVVRSLIRSNEAAARRVGGTSGATSCAATTLADRLSVPSGSYCIVLNRLADPSGQTYWTGQLAGSGQLTALWTSLGASNEYFTNAQS